MTARAGAAPPVRRERPRRGDIGGRVETLRRKPQFRKDDFKRREVVKSGVVVKRC